MKYQVEVVADRDLPDGVTKVLVECDDGTQLLLLAESVSGPWRFVQAVEALEDGKPQAFEMLPAAS